MNFRSYKGIDFFLRIIYNNNMKYLFLIISYLSLLAWVVTGELGFGVFGLFCSTESSLLHIEDLIKEKK